MIGMFKELSGQSKPFVITDYLGNRWHVKPYLTGNYYISLAISQLMNKAGIRTPIPSLITRHQLILLTHPDDTNMLMEFLHRPVDIKTRNKFRISKLADASLFIIQPYIEGTPLRSFDEIPTHLLDKYNQIRQIEMMYKLTDRRPEHYIITPDKTDIIPVDYEYTQYKFKI